MAADLSKTKANERLEKVKAQLANMRERASEEAEHFLSTGVKVGTGAALGALDHWASSRPNATGPALIGNVDNSLLVGALGTAAAVLKVGGEKVSARARDVGDAGFTIYAYKWAWQAMADRARGRAAAESSTETSQGRPPGSTAAGSRAGDVRG